MSERMLFLMLKDDALVDASRASVPHLKCLGSKRNITMVISYPILSNQKETQTSQLRWALCNLDTLRGFNYCLLNR